MQRLLFAESFTRESLAAYEKENNRTQKRLKAQRNLAYGVGTVLLVALVRK